jgi:hypothetical protein
MPQKQGLEKQGSGFGSKLDIPFWNIKDTARRQTLQTVSFTEQGVAMSASKVHSLQFRYFFER